MPHPVCGLRLRIPDPSEYGCGPDNEKFAQVAIAHLRDPAQPVLSAGRILSRHQSEPGRELTRSPELGRICDGCRQGRGREDAHARACRQSLTNFARPMPCFDLPVELVDWHRKVNASSCAKCDMAI